MLLCSSGIQWETRKPGKSKYEAVSRGDNLLLEDAHKHGRSHAALADGVQADLELCKLGKRDLRRSYQPGLWVQLRVSRHQQHFHAKLHTLQVDCQLPDCVFPTILAPVPLPKSVAADKGKSVNSRVITCHKFSW